MNTLEIICESCESRMKLSESLLDKIAGKTGRVTCKQCENKIVLDASGSEVAVKEGGFSPDAVLGLEPISDSNELSPDSDVHLSEFPDPPESQRERGELSLPPPLGEEEAPISAHDEPRLEELAAVVSPMPDSVDFEAPEPVGLRPDEGSLSPYSIGEDEGDENLVELGREFNSSPFTSPRDFSLQSLYPDAKKASEKQGSKRVVVPPNASKAPSPYVSQAPAPPKAGELRRGSSQSEIFEGDIAAAPAVMTTDVELGADGQLINKTDRAGGKAEERRAGAAWVPWAVAAAALLAFGGSVFMKKDTQVIVEASQASEVKSGAAAPAESEDVATAQLEEDAEIAEAEGPVEELSDVAESDASQAEPAVAEPAVAEPAVAEPTVASKKASEKEETAKADDTEEATGSAEAETAEGETDAESAEVDATKDGATEDGATEDGATDEPDLPPFSSASAAAALRESTAMAAACRGPEDPTGYAKVIVTFAPSGRVTRASVSGPPFAGTQTGGCIASRFRAARVPAFSGDFVTVTKTVAIR